MGIKGAWIAVLCLVLSACVVKQGPGVAAPPPGATPGGDQATATNPAGNQPQATAQSVVPPAGQGSAAATQGQASNFGTVSLRSGFTPDPHVVQGTSGGTQNAATINQACNGWISHRPDHIFVAETAYASLRIMVNSEQDVTLVVQRPDGSYVCNDDSEGLNPMVTGSFPAGRYSVWVGSYREGEMAPYRLGFSELSTVTPGSLAAGGSGGATSNFGTVTLAPGFTPDPHVARGTSGGQVEATTIRANCRGWISQVPDHILVAGGNFSSLRILVRSGQDTTLVVADEAGNVWCDDDTEGRNPVVNGAFRQGRYRVWVGSYNQGDHSTYSLGFSELSSVRTSTLPAP